MCKVVADYTYFRSVGYTRSMIQGRKAFDMFYDSPVWQGFNLTRVATDANAVGYVDEVEGTGLVKAAQYIHGGGLAINVLMVRCDNKTDYEEVKRLLGFNKCSCVMS